MRRFSAFLYVALLAGVSAAHAFDVPDVKYPDLAKAAASAEGFVPAGWKLEKQIAGDLNADGIADLVLVLRQTDPNNVISHDILGENPLDTNPRILAVAFGRASPSGFVLALENHTLIPRREVPTADDPLSERGGVVLEKGTLRIKLNYFTSAGGWSTSLTSHTFRWQNQRFELIGFDRRELMRNSGEEREVSINYSTARMSITTGNMESNKKTVSWRNLPRRPLLTIERIGNGVEFEPEK